MRPAHLRATSQNLTAVTHTPDQTIPATTTPPMLQPTSQRPLRHPTARPPTRVHSQKSKHKTTQKDTTQQDADIRHMEKKGRRAMPMPPNCNEQHTNTGTHCNQKHHDQHVAVPHSQAPNMTRAPAKPTRAARSNNRNPQSANMKRPCTEKIAPIQVRVYTPQQAT